MTVLPSSGKSAYMIWRKFVETPEPHTAAVHIPIFNWSLSSLTQRDVLRTSNSKNYPIRPKGTFEHNLFVTGAEYIPRFYDEPNGDEGILGYLGIGLTFDVGYFEPNDFTQVREFTLDARLSEFRVDFFYNKGNLVDFQWSANFIINRFRDEDSLYSNGDDVVVCFNKICEQQITTTDTELHEGIVKHIRRASIITTIEYELFCTSRSDNNFDLFLNEGVLDRHLEMEIEGDFDYWFKQINDSIPQTYKFYYSPTDFWLTKNMVVENVNNMKVNAQTGALISATVLLGVDNV